MDLVLEVFPGYNPLPKLVETFRILEATDEITDHEIVCEIIQSAFEEAGVIFECQDELIFVINLLVGYDVLQFIEGKTDPYLVSNPLIGV